jgi:hypothetical protein
VGREAGRVAGATHCLGEWPEPDDATAEAPTTDELLLRRVVLEYARTLTAAGMVMRWSIDIEADAVMIVLTPVNELDREALESATMEVERVFDAQVGARDRRGRGSARGDGRVEEGRAPPGAQASVEKPTSRWNRHSRGSEPTGSIGGPSCSGGHFYG